MAALVRARNLTLLTLTATTAGCGQVQEIEPLENRPIDRPAYRVTLPEGWVRDEDPVPTPDVPGHRRDLDFDGPVRAGFPSNGNVGIDRLPVRGVSATRYARDATSYLTHPERLRSKTGARLPPQEIHYRRRTQLDGVPAVEVRFGDSENEALIRYAVRGRRGFTLLLTGAKDGFAPDARAFRELANSWEWAD